MFRGSPGVAQGEGLKPGLNGFLKINQPNSRCIICKIISKINFFYMKFYICTHMGTYLSFGLFHLVDLLLRRMPLLWKCLCRCAIAVKPANLCHISHRVDLEFNVVDWIIEMV